jgi:hypothetical protein
LHRKPKLLKAVFEYYIRGFRQTTGGDVLILTYTQVKELLILNQSSNNSSPWQHL